MRSNFRKCKECGTYTLESTCINCSCETFCPNPVKFSPYDTYGKYRRITIKKECGEDGKYNTL